MCLNTDKVKTFEGVVKNVTFYVDPHCVDASTCHREKLAQNHGNGAGSECLQQHNTHFTLKNQRSVTPPAASSSTSSSSRCLSVTSRFKSPSVSSSRPSETSACSLFREGGTASCRGAFCKHNPLFVTAGGMIVPLEEPGINQACFHFSQSRFRALLREIPAGS